MGIFKTRDEHERQEKLKHAQRLREDEERRRSKFDKRDYQCKVEGCGLKFPDIAELYAHIEKHNEEMRKALVCNKPRCGKKCQNEKEYFAHIEEHKAESKRKIKNSLRAVLP